MKNKQAMTEIREFLRKINNTPSYMTKVNWKTETEGFRYRRLRAIIVGIKEVEVCQLAREYIINAWCYTMAEPSDEIVRRLDQCFEERKAKVLKRLHKQELDNKARSLDKTMLYDDADRANEPFVCDNLFSQHYYQEYHRLQNENAQLKAELEKYKSDSEHAINKARIEGIRSMVEQLIIYGEKFPCNQNDKAEVIKEALLAKSFKGHIPSDALSPQWQERLMNLGRKEQGVTFQGESMFNISGNDQVNIGGNNGRK